MDREQAVKYLQSSGFSEEQIKAIEGAFTCEDAISRQEMLKYFEGWKNKIKYYHPYAKNFDIPYEEAIQWVKDMSPVNPQKPKTGWIPVSERLPEEFQRVLVTVVNYEGNKVVRVAEYYNRKAKGVFRIKENYEEWEVGEKGLLSWMSLPEPYKAEGSES